MDTLKNLSSYLQKNLIGIERESLRIKKTGCIATTNHPANFGSPLTNRFITTDFSESLIEIITPALNEPKKVLNFLEDTLHFAYYNLENEENLWPISMPCIIRGQTEINIAKYGSSNQAKMKETYRNGLANRYGKAMQVVAGLHFNYSFSDDFWQKYQILLNNKSSQREFKDDKYMAIIRNVLRYGWVLYYYFGASNSVCKSFLNNYHDHSLVEFNDNTLYMPYATSLRMGDIGYQNTREDEAGVKANYNSICQYTHSLQSAMQTPFAEYCEFDHKDELNQQLNCNILQIENEYYSSVRPKPKPESGIMPSISLAKNGIEYVELRGLDINPLNPLGIDEEQILFLESFLLFCLTADSKPISTKEQVEIDRNNIKVAHYGLDKNLKLTIDNNEVLLQSELKNINANILDSSSIFSQKHQDSVKAILKRQSPSTKILQQMRDEKQGFHSKSNEYAKKYQQYFENKKINIKHFEMLQNESTESIKKTQAIEASDTIDFETFLKNYFNQL